MFEPMSKGSAILNAVSAYLRQCIERKIFPGCAIVADPLRGAGFVLMTNHTFPRRRTNRDDINAVRNRLADLVFGGRKNRAPDLKQGPFY